MTDADEPRKQDAPASSDGFCEIVDEAELYPNETEHRIPDCGAPYPEGLNDPGSRDLTDTARWFLSCLLVTFWSPAALARLEEVWQWRKFDFLDWLRPIELLLRRLLLIEAIGLLLSQALPPLCARSIGKTARPPQPARSFDPDRPETWRVSFMIVPPAPRAGGHRIRQRLPPVQPHHIRGQPHWRLRSRRVLHRSVPLALRLEAVIRVTMEPGKYARRLALRLQRRRNPNVSFLVIPRPRPFPVPAPRDALLVAGERAADLHHAWWSSA